MAKKFLKLEKNIWFIIYLVVLVFFYILLQNASINLKVRKKILEAQIEKLRAREIILRSELMKMTLQGQLEQELKKRNVNLKSDHNIPKVIFIKDQNE